MQLTNETENRKSLEGTRVPGAFVNQVPVHFARNYYLIVEAIAPDGLAQLLSTDYKFAVSFAILLIVLLFRPTGLFAGKSV